MKMYRVGIDSLFSFLGMVGFLLMLSGCGIIQYESESEKPRGMALLGADTFGLSESGQDALEIEPTSSVDKGEKSDEKVIVYFSLDGYSLEGQNTQLLDGIAKKLKANKALKLYVDGYTCELGGGEYNVGLGYKRARARAAYLVDQGVDKSQLMLLSYGKEKPIDPGHSEASRKKNRRVEVSFVPEEMQG